jgi:hypothetical protein
MPGICSGADLGSAGQCLESIATGLNTAPDSDYSEQIRGSTDTDIQRN